MSTISPATAKAVTWIAREAYGRILSILAAQTGDIPRAEDALSDALQAALQNWPEKGIPDTPEAWILTTAKRRLIDQGRRSRTEDTNHEHVLQTYLNQMSDHVETENSAIPDKRLELLFVCAHPAIQQDVHAPLMLQTVLGLSARQIGPLFCVDEKLLGQQLVRAKRKIKTSVIPFVVPGQDDLPYRVMSVLDAIYAAFAAGQNERDVELMDEAIYLADLCAALLPEQMEARGLLALCLYARSRFGSDRSEDNQFIPLSDQKTEQWNIDLIVRAEKVLHSASLGRQIGRYQVEAAIQSAHMIGRLDDTDQSRAIIGLYEQLILIAPSLGAHVGLAAAHLASGKPLNALRILDGLSGTWTRYQPYWGTRAATLAELSRSVEAIDAYENAISLTKDQSIERHLKNKQRLLMESQE